MKKDNNIIDFKYYKNLKKLSDNIATGHNKYYESSQINIPIILTNHRDSINTALDNLENHHKKINELILSQNRHKKHICFITNIILTILAIFLLYLLST